MARIGGTQFLVLTLHLEESECATVTGRIREHLGAPATPRVRRRPGGGLLRLDERQGGEQTSLEDLVARSDWAMLESRDGRREGFGPFGASGT